MDQKTRRTAIVIGALVALFLVFTSTVDIYTDWLWFASLGQLSTYQTRLWTRASLWLVGALLVMLVLAINWLLIPRRLLGRLRRLAASRLHLRDRRNRALPSVQECWPTGSQSASSCAWWRPSSPW